VKVRAQGITDTGQVRDNNEDNYLVDNEMGLYLVADGMGGHQAGEVASQLAVEITHKYLTSDSEITNKKEIFLNSQFLENLSPRARILVEGIKLANKIIHQVGQEENQYHGMGCTIAALITDPPHGVIIANVGDSRIYLMRENHIQQLNQDHTLLNEYLRADPEFAVNEGDFQTSHLNHILVRALGSDPQVEVDVQEITFQNNDLFLLCSDGLTDMMEDEKILEVMKSEKTVDKMCSKLVTLANERGGLDNITVVIVEIAEK